jgi:hypothetical protein
MDPHCFWKLAQDPDPHKSEKLNPDQETGVDLVSQSSLTYNSNTRNP